MLGSHRPFLNASRTVKTDQTLPNQLYTVIKNAVHFFYFLNCFTVYCYLYSSHVTSHYVRLSHALRCSAKAAVSIFGHLPVTCYVTPNVYHIGWVIKQLFHAFYRQYLSSLGAVDDPMHYRTRPSGLVRQCAGSFKAPQGDSFDCCPQRHDIVVE